MMAKKVIDYDGNIPPGILTDKFNQRDFYTPEQVRKIISDNFPSQGEILFNGLDYIAKGDRELSWSDYARKATNRKDLSRNELLEERIPDIESALEEVTIDIGESQVFHDLKANFPSFEKHITRLTLTELGYILEDQFTSTSNKP